MFLRRQILPMSKPIDTRSSAHISGISDRPAKYGRQPISMAGKTSKASTPRPGSAAKLPDRHEAFVQAYITNGFNATKAYRAVYPKTKTDHIAQACSSRLLSNANQMLWLALASPKSWLWGPSAPR
jgi:hypothetical protein